MAATISSALVAGGGTSTLRIASWCFGSSSRSGMWTVEVVVEREVVEARLVARSAAAARGSRGRAGGRRARRGRAPTVAASKPNAGASARERGVEVGPRRARAARAPRASRRRRARCRAGARSWSQMRCAAAASVGRPGGAGGTSRRAPRPDCAARRRGRRATGEVAPVLRQPGGEEVRLVEQQADAAARAASP